MRFVLIGDTAPMLLNAVYADPVRAIPEQFRGLPYYGLFDGDWWNAAWVFPAAAGAGLALTVFDLFVRGPLRFVVFGPILYLAHAVARRW